MPSSYSPNLRIELPSPGEQANTWGNTTNVNLGTLIESAITGATLITTLPTTLTTKNGAADTSRNMALLVTASLAADSYIIAPALPKMYVVYNTTAGGHNVTIKADLGGGVYSTGVTVPNGQSRIVYYSSALSDFFAATTYDISVSGTAGTTPAASGLIKTGSLNAGTLSLTVAPATSSYLGGVKPNSTQFTTASDGALTLNPPSGSSVGGVKSGAIVLADGSGVLGLAASGVSANTYTNATVTVDTYGRVTSASSGSGGTGVTSLSTTTTQVVITPSGGTGSVTLNLDTSSGTGLATKTYTDATYLPLTGGTVTSTTGVDFVYSSGVTAKLRTSVVQNPSPYTGYYPCISAIDTALSGTYPDMGFIQTNSTTSRLMMYYGAGGDAFFLYNLSCAGTKPFRINHPTVAGKKLYHIAVEAPRADLIYRGEVKLVNGTATVDIDASSRMTYGTFVALTQNVAITSLQNKDGFTRVKGSAVVGNSFTITAEDPSCTDTIVWVVMAERNDVGMHSNPLCDADGRIIPEHIENTP